MLRVTTRWQGMAILPLIFTQHWGTEVQSFYYFSVSLCLPNYCMRVAKISQFSIPPHGTNRKVPPSWGEIIDEWDIVFHCVPRLHRNRLKICHNLYELYRLNLHDESGIRSVRSQVAFISQGENILIPGWERRSPPWDCCL